MKSSSMFSSIVAQALETARQSFAVSNAHAHPASTVVCIERPEAAGGRSAMRRPSSPRYDSLRRRCGFSFSYWQKKIAVLDWIDEYTASKASSRAATV
jgi:hypothetical protein